MAIINIAEVKCPVCNRKALVDIHDCGCKLGYCQSCASEFGNTNHCKNVKKTKNKKGGKL